MKDSIHSSFSNHKIKSIDWITYTGKAISDNQFRLNIQLYPDESENVPTKYSIISLNWIRIVNNMVPDSQISESELNCPSCKEDQFI